MQSPWLSEQRAYQHVAPGVSGGFSPSPRPPGKKGRMEGTEQSLLLLTPGEMEGRRSTGQARVLFSKGCISWSIHHSSEIVTDGIELSDPVTPATPDSLHPGEVVQPGGDALVWS